MSSKNATDPFNSTPTPQENSSSHLYLADPAENCTVTISSYSDVKSFEVVTDDWDKKWVVDDIYINDAELHLDGELCLVFVEIMIKQTRTNNTSAHIKQSPTSA